MAILAKYKTYFRRTLAAITLSAALTAYTGTVSYLADKHNINDKVVYPYVYKDHETAPGFTENPFDLEKRVTINEDGELETYFGNRRTDEFHRVCSNDRTCYTIEDFFSDARDIYYNARDKADDIIDAVKDKKEVIFDSLRIFFLSNYQIVKNIMDSF